MKFWQQQSSGKTNPVSMFFDWKSDKENKTGKFVWWNKDLEAKVDVIPTEFILLLATNCVKGWDDASNSGIFSNEIINLKTEELTVRAFKREKSLYQGVYDRNQLEALNCKFNKGIIAQEGETMVEYYFQGSSLYAFNEDTSNIDYNNYKIAFDRVEEMKKGAVTYYVPRRKQGSKITDEERAVAMANVELLEDYHRGNE